MPVEYLRYFELWGDGFEALIAGDSITDIKRHMKISLSAVMFWEKRVMELLEKMNPTVLKDWIIWQRNRDRHRRAILVHHHGVRFPQAGLVRSQRKKT